jgi:hypothetical protein
MLSKVQQRSTVQNGANFVLRITLSEGLGFRVFWQENQLVIRT